MERNSTRKSKKERLKDLQEIHHYLKETYDKMSTLQVSRDWSGCDDSLDTFYDVGRVCEYLLSAKRTIENRLFSMSEELMKTHLIEELADPRA